MSDARRAGSFESPGKFDRGFKGHRRRQARRGLHLSPAERLRWLEETMEELRSLLGRARRAPRLNQQAD